MDTSNRLRANHGIESWRVAATGAAVFAVVIAWALFRSLYGEPAMRTQSATSAHQSIRPADSNVSGVIEAVDGHLPPESLIVYSEHGFTMSGWVRMNSSDLPNMVHAVIDDEVVGSAVPIVAPDGLWRYTINVPSGAVEPGASQLSVRIESGQTTQTAKGSVLLVVR